MVVMSAGEGAGSATGGGAEARCGYVALLGAPNAGKSTLFNALVGEALSIATPRAQTTQRRIIGIRTEPGTQWVFLDAPGILEPRDGLQEALLIGAKEVAREADVQLLVVHPSSRSEASRQRLVEVSREGRGAKLGVVTRADQVGAEALGDAVRWFEDVVGVPALIVSGKTGQGVPELLETVRAALPVGPFLFPEDDLAADPVRFFAAERVREALLELYDDEVPHAAFCVVDEYREPRTEGEATYIRVVIHVEKASQKGIIIGAGGRAIRELGTRARTSIEHFVGGPVYLDLWVKVLPGWRRKRAHLRRLGFPVPEEEGKGG